MARNPRTSRRKNIHPPAPLLKVELMRSEGDCGIASIASLTGSPYEDVLIEASKESRIGRHPHKSGLYLSNMLRITKRLGCPLRFKKTCNLEVDQGILSVTWKSGVFPHHVVLLIKGMIFDMADATVWEPKDYKRVHKATFGSILSVT